MVNNNPEVPQGRAGSSGGVPEKTKKIVIGLVIFCIFVLGAFVGLKCN